jgi:hypothetical protein
MVESEFNFQNYAPSARKADINDAFGVSLKIPISTSNQRAHVCTNVLFFVRVEHELWPNLLIKLFRSQKPKRHGGLLQSSPFLVCLLCGLGNVCTEGFSLCLEYGSVYVLSYPR